MRSAWMWVVARSRLLRFLLRRVILLALSIVVISFLVFVLVYLSPGNAVTMLLGSRPATPALVRELTAKYYLNHPFMVQYLHWLNEVVHLNLGDSVQTSQPVSSIIASRLPVTLFLGVYAFTLATAFGISFGLLAALKGRTVIDRAVVTVSIVSVSAPVFVTGFLLLYVFGVVLKWFPIFGAGEGFIGRLWHLTLPAVALALALAAVFVKLTRAAATEVLEQDYVTFARARGLPLARIIRRYVLRNSWPPVVAAGGLILGIALAGSVIVEQVFAVPGLGTMLVNAVAARDVPVIQGYAICASVALMGANLLADVISLVLDPRLSRQLEAP
jgi:peptide/nickel transport system permease protein